LLCCFVVIFESTAIIIITIITIITITTPTNVKI
jgi:hypothetical protein